METFEIGDNVQYASSGINLITGKKWSRGLVGKVVEKSGDGSRYRVADAIDLRSYWAKPEELSRLSYDPWL